MFVLRSPAERRDRSRDLDGVLEALDLAGEVSLPASVENERLRLLFEADPQRGAVLCCLTERDGGTHLDWRMRPAAELDAAYDGLWTLRGLRRGTKREVIVTPRDAAEFRAFATRGAQGLVLLWRGIAVEQKAGETLWVVVHVGLGPDEAVSRWSVRVGRDHGVGFSIDEIDLPVLWVRGPVAPRPFETHLLAQRRTRLFIPTALMSVRPFWSSNDSFYLWAAVDVTRKEVHPGPGQVLQFSALYAADPGDEASYRRMLYLGSEDTGAVHKTFEHAGTTVETAEGTEAWYRWTHTFFAPFGDAFANPEDPPASEFGNTYASRYPAVVGAMRAKTDAFWYDACAFYRAFVARSGIGGPKIEVNTLLSPMKNPGIKAFYIFEPTLVEASPTVYGGMLDRTLAFQAALENPYQPNEPVYMHLQNWFDGGMGVDFNPPFPIEKHIDPGVVQLLREANARDIRVSGYTLPEGLDETWFEFFPIEATHWTREGVRRGEAPEKQRIPDYRNPAANGWFAEFVYPDMMKLGFRGVYADVISGSPSILAYDPPPPFRAPALAHGGSWVTGVRESFLETRRALERSSLFRAGDELDRDVFVMSELVEEGIVGVVDLVQDGYIWLPQHLLLAEETLIPLAVTEVPDAARDLSPPVWTAVYHEYQPTGRLGLPQSTVALATNERFYPDEDGFGGMTAEEFVDYYRFFPASIYIAGNRLIFIDQLHFESPIVSLADGHAVVDPAVDPTGAGLDVMRFVRTLYSSSRRDFAGRFVDFGQLQRPLQVDYRGSGTTLVRNPVFATRKTNPKNFLGVFSATYAPFEPEFAQNFAAWGTFDFPVPAVLHSLWRSPEGQLGLVMVNWTGDAAVLAGRFDPTLYGFGARETFVARELLLGQDPKARGTFSGTIQVRTEDGPVVLGGDLLLGKMRPTSVRVIVFDHR